MEPQRGTSTKNGWAMPLTPDRARCGTGFDTRSGGCQRHVGDVGGPCDRDRPVGGGAADRVPGGRRLARRRGWRVLRPGGRGDPGLGGGERLRQIGQRAVHHGPAAPARQPGDGACAAGGQGHRGPAPPGAGAVARRPSGHGVPGADDEPEPGDDHRRPGGGKPAHPSRRVRQGRPAGRAGGAGGGEDSFGPQPVRRLPAPFQRRQCGSA